jgi:putative nucleotidyltransferase with HDIG domain
MLGFAVVSLTSVVGYRFYNQPQLSVGTLSPITIRAPRDAHFLDPKTTEDKRKATRNGIIPVLKRDDEITQQLKSALVSHLQQIDQLRQRIGQLPILSLALLSLPSQQYLRACSEPSWQQVLGSVTPHNFAEQSQPIEDLQRQAIAQLQAYRQKVSPATFGAAIAQIERARQRYASTWAQWETQQGDHLDAEVDRAFLSLSEPNWQATKKAILQTTDLILMQGISPGTPPQLLQEAIAMHLQSKISAQVEPGIAQWLVTLLQAQPNLTVDEEETKRQAEQAAQAVKPVTIAIERGQIIVAVGQTITQEAFVLLDGFGLSRRQTNGWGLGVSAMLVSSSLGIFCLMDKRIHRPLRRRDHLLLCLLSVSAPLLALVQVRYLNLPAIGLLTSSFYGPTLAVTQVLLLSGLSSFATETINWDYVLAGTAGGLLAAFMAGRLRSRDELSLLGAGVGLIQGGVYFVTQLVAGSVAGIVWYAILPHAVIYGLLGVAWVVVAIGLSPYLERFFDLITPIRLVELSNPNCPLLKRLATEAPGTFQHTLFVACLAEAAARALHCNVELVRAGTLYHDIGKMHDPLSFIENQMGGVNKHDEMNEPWKSAEIIKKHVSEGLVMARKYGLPRVIRDFIPEHQGTLLISYFYYQAQHRAEQEDLAPVSESEFRYDGPIPQSRETGLVMLADGCEAALRSLKDATPELASATIQKMFKARWRDNQLKDSGIKYEELPIIADVFVQVWQQFHHRRIVYPNAALEPKTGN